PNFPTPRSPDPDGLRVNWDYVSQAGPPMVYLMRFDFERTPGHWQRMSRMGAEYLGWNDKGSLIKNQLDGRVYIWNLKQDRLSVVYQNESVIPRDVLASLHRLDDVPTPLFFVMSPKK